MNNNLYNNNIQNNNMHNDNLYNDNLHNDNLHNKIANEILGLKTYMNMGRIKMHIFDNTLMYDSNTPYKLRLRITDELMGGYYLMNLLDEELKSSGITNLKCKFYNVKYIHEYMNTNDTLRIFTFCLVTI